MKCLILVSGKNKKNIINLSSAEFAQRLVKATMLTSFIKGLKSCNYFSMYFCHAIF